MWCGAAEQARFLLLFQSIAVALNYQRVTVVQQSIENRRREHLVAEDATSLRHELIRGDEQAAALVAGHELKEEMRAASLEREIPEVVDDQEFRLRSRR